ncbi:unnamed protein product [Effrenium voratum]|nr:unnamed protein product [Effrenium voratum]
MSGSLVAKKRSAWDEEEKAKPKKKAKEPKEKPSKKKAKDQPCDPWESWDPWAWEGAWGPWSPSAPWGPSAPSAPSGAAAAAPSGAEGVSGAWVEPPKAKKDKAKAKKDKAKAATAKLSGPSQAINQNQSFSGVVTALQPRSGDLLIDCPAIARVFGRPPVIRAAANDMGARVGSIVVFRLRPGPDPVATDIVINGFDWELGDAEAEGVTEDGAERPGFLPGMRPFLKGKSKGEAKGWFGEWKGKGLGEQKGWSGWGEWKGEKGKGPFEKGMGYKGPGKVPGKEAWSGKGW